MRTRIREIMIRTVTQIATSSPAGLDFFRRVMARRASSRWKRFWNRIVNLGRSGKMIRSI
jgi:hypothetical protein